MKLEWDDLRFFLVLCRHPSFVAAGHELKVTHSTVARRLTALEGTLGTQLFIRSEKGCRLTPAGEKLFREHHEHHLHLTRELQAALTPEETAQFASILAKLTQAI